MRQEDIITASLETFEGTHIQKHDPYDYIRHLVLSGKDNACQVSFYELPPHKSNYPYHYHTNVTEVFYIIRGKGVLKTPGGEKVVQAGDVVVCPPYEKGAHKITNASDTETLVYLDVDTASETDITVYPDSGKIGVLAYGHYTAFFKKEDEKPYYEGE